MIYLILIAALLIPYGIFTVRNELYKRKLRRLGIDRSK